MARRPCELVPALLAVALVACSQGGPVAPTARPAATPTTSAPSTTSDPRVAPGTPSPVGKPYVIGVIGDYGVDAAPVRQVVKAMNAWRLDAVVTTGDNAYCCGSAPQSRFASRMLDPLRPAPIYPALGNHDVVTRDGADLMAAFGMTRRWYTATVGPVQLLVLDSTRVANATQIAYLKKVLAAPRPGVFRVVAFHHPGWSCSAHEADPLVIKHWLPLFGTKVDLVLAGHNHTYERFAAATGTPYVTTGGGGARLYPSSSAACRGAGKMKFLKTVHHAVRLVATRAALRVEAVGTDGAVFDKVTIAPR